MQVVAQDVLMRSFRVVSLGGWYQKEEDAWEAVQGGVLLGVAWRLLKVDWKFECYSGDKVVTKMNFPATPKIIRT